MMESGTENSKGSIHAVQLKKGRLMKKGVISEILTNEDRGDKGVDEIASVQLQGLDTSNGLGVASKAAIAAQRLSDSKSSSEKPTSSTVNEIYEKKRFPNDFFYDEIKSVHSKLKVGTFRFTTEKRRNVRYVYVPASYLSGKYFNLEEIFQALNISAVPSIFFDINAAEVDTNEWNVRLPDHKQDLAKFAASQEKFERQQEVRSEPSQGLLSKRMMKQLDLYKVVVRENIKRLFQGTAIACKQANAVFLVGPEHVMKVKDDIKAKKETPSADADATKTDGEEKNGIAADINQINSQTDAKKLDEDDGEDIGNMEHAHDYIADWLAETPVKMLGVGGIDSFHPEFVNKLKEAGFDFSLKTMSEPMEADDAKERKRVIRIDVDAFVNKSLEGRLGNLPHLKLTHLIVCESKAELKKKLKQIPSGLMLVNGGNKRVAQRFVEAVRDRSPVFIFKYTGGAADLAIEMLDAVDIWLAQKKLKRTIAPMSIPFPRRRPAGWLLPFDQKHMKMCNVFNIMTQNFPDRYNPAAILRIDMFTTSEDQLQDKLTKTMSVAFEGSSTELGARKSEIKRLTYAWKLRHKLFFNANLQKSLSDALTVMMILLSVFSTCSAVVLTYLQFGGQFSPFDHDHDLTLLVLNKLNLLLPLAVAVLRGIEAAVSPYTKYQALSTARFNVEKEIYMYRAKVGRYNPAKDGSDSHNNKKVDEKKGAGGKDKKDAKGVKEDKKSSPAEPGDDGPEFSPGKLFSQALDKIWTDLGASSVSTGALVDPFESLHPLDDINKLINSNLKHQKRLRDGLMPYGIAAVKENMFDSMFDNDNSKDGNGGVDDYDSDEGDRENDAEDAKAKDADGNWIGGAAEFEGDQGDGQEQVLPETSSAPATLASAKKPRDGRAQNKATATVAPDDIESQDIRSKMSNLISVPKIGFNNTEEEEKKPADVSKEPVYDDGLSMMTAEDYMNLRLIPIVASLQAKAPNMSMMNNLANVFVVTLSVVSSVLSTFELSIFIPAAIAFGSAINAFSSYTQVVQKVTVTNGSFIALQQRDSANKESLVMSTEAAVQAQMVSYVQTASAPNDDNDGNSAEK